VTVTVASTYRGGNGFDKGESNHTTRAAGDDGNRLEMTSAGAAPTNWVAPNFLT